MAVADILIHPIVAADAGQVLTLQRAAYVTEAQIYDDPFLPALIQDLASLEAELAVSIGLKAVDASYRVVGAIRMALDGSTGRIGRLVVAPDWQGRRVGTALLKAVQGVAPAAVTRFELFTGHRSVDNIRLYERCGFTRYSERALTPDVRLVFLARVRE